MTILYKKDVISNVKIHPKIKSSGDKEKSETYTKYINIFDIDGMGMEYESGRPVAISDNDLLSVAYKDGWFGRKIKGMWNGSNQMYAGDISWPYFLLSILMAIVVIFFIFLDFPPVVESFKPPVKLFKTTINFNVFFEGLRLIVPIAGGVLSVLFLMLGINTRKMISKVKAL